MSRVTQCDVCKAIIKCKYKARITRFDYVAKYESGHLIPLTDRERLKIDICDGCLENLRKIAKEIDANDKT